jgi:hypothetical protein
MVSYKVLDLNSLDVGIPAITSRQAGVHMEACVWCLLECGHSIGVSLQVDDLGNPDNYSIVWPEQEIDVEALDRAYNQDDAPEHGAEAIALLLVREKTNYTAIRRSITSTGIDYWLGYQQTVNNQIFNESNARLEVSGILRQSPTNQVKYRVKSKRNQTRRSDNFCFPAFVVVVEFSQPIANLSHRNV